MIKEATTLATSKIIGRSKYAIDVMYRLWDNYNHRWVSVNNKTIWYTKLHVTRARENLILKGKDPDTLEVTRVFVEVK